MLCNISSNVVFQFRAIRSLRKFCRSVHFMTDKHYASCKHNNTSYSRLLKFRHEFQTANQRSFMQTHPSSSKQTSYINQENIPDLKPHNVINESLRDLYHDIRRELQTEDKHLHEISSYFFDGNGKAIRPSTVLLMSHAINGTIRNEQIVLPPQRKIAMIAEMIHTASLFHDDVIDKSQLRRGKPTVNHMWGTTDAVLAGDYIISVAAALLARIGNKDVITVLSQVLVDLVQGEFMQLGSKEDEGERFTHYISRIYKKTASLFANSCKAVAILANADENIQRHAFEYGRNFGIAFQLIDDILDFKSSDLAMGKPTSADLKLGVATAPVLFACQKYPEINVMIMRRFSEPNDVEFTNRAVLKSDGLQKAFALAQQHSNLAKRHLSCLDNSPGKTALENLSEMIIRRLK